MRQGTGQRAAYGKASGFLDDLNRAAKDNPIAATLIGAGIAWMFFGNRPLKSLGRQLPRAARGTMNAVGSGAAAAGGMASQGARSATDAVSSAASRVGEGIEQMTDGLRASMRSAPSRRESYYEEASEGTSWASDYGSQARELAGGAYENLAAAMERQPLLLGALGLAAGVGLALAYPPTQQEKEMLGEAGGALKEKAQDLAGDLFETAKQRTAAAAKAMADEAQKQGLTADALKDEFSSQAAKIKNVAADSVRRR